MLNRPMELQGASGGIDDRDGEQLRHWFALYTAVNHEKSVQRNLRLREVETFLPLYTVSKRWKNRVTAKVELPLFASYVFARISLRETVKVLSVPKVYSIVGNSHEPLPLPDEEIEKLRTGLGGRLAAPWPYVKVGDRARVIRGPLAGLEGIVVRSDNQLRLVLSLDLIAKSIAIHVSADDIEVCDRAAQKDGELSETV